MTIKSFRLKALILIDGNSGFCVVDALEKYTELEDWQTRTPLWDLFGAWIEARADERRIRNLFRRRLCWCDILDLKSPRRFDAAINTSSLRGRVSHRVRAFLGTTFVGRITGTANVALRQAIASRS